MVFARLTTPERIKLIQTLSEKLLLEEILDINLYFSEFGIQSRIDPWEPLLQGIRESLQSTNDETLVKIDGFISEGKKVSEDVFNTWKSGGIRLFMSHSSSQKAFVSFVADKLDVFGIESFVAHDDIQSGTTWFEVMTNAIRTCDVFVAFIHEDFKLREWCDHELGFALGLNLQPLLLNFGHEPYGFLKQLQNEKVKDRTDDEIASIVFNWLSNIPAYEAQLEDNLVTKFVNSNNFNSTRSIHWKINELKNISRKNYEKIEAAFKSNDQVYNWGGFKFVNGNCTWLLNLENKVTAT